MTGIASDPSGVVYLIVDSGARLVGVTFDEEIVGSVEASLSSPSNTVFDPSGDSLFSLSGDQLVLVDAETGSTETKSEPLELSDPMGLTVDPATGDAFVLESGAHQMTRVTPSGEVDRIPLRQLNSYEIEGLSYNPEDGLLYVAAPSADLLWGLDPSSGRVVTTYGLSDVGVTSFGGMVFAPSADPTDDPDTYNLYMVDNEPVQTTDTIYEVSISEQVQIAATDTAILVNSTDLSALNPPSSDSAGITYLPGDGWLLFSDSEINEEPGVYQDVNLWELTRDGTTVEDTGTTYPFYSDEPTGVSVNTSNGFLYVSDDNGDDVYDVDPGLDGRYGTSDDTFTFTDTTAGDAEGVVYHPSSGDLFVVHGLTTDVERISPGADGRFNNSSDETFDVFDVATFGAGDPEGIGYNHFADTLLVLDDNSNAVYELTPSGSLVRIIDISASGARNPAGLVLAPASDGSSAWHMYIVDRGIDNNAGGDWVDGALYEMALDFGSGNTPPTASFTYSCTDLTCDFTDTSTDSDGSVVTWSWDFGDSAGTSTAQNPTYTYPAAGVYTVTLTVTDDGTATDTTSQDVTVSDVALPEVSVVATDASAAEPTDNGEFTFSRSGGTTGSLTVNYTVTGTATPNADYTALSGSVTIPDGQASATEAVAVLDDSEAEDPETVVVTIDADASYTIGTSGSDTVTVTDDGDPPEVTVTATASDAAEPSDNGEFTFSRTGPTTGSLTVNYTDSGTATPDSDYTALTGSVTIPDGQASATETVTVIDDSEIESAETVTVTIDPDSTYIIGTPSSDTVTITDDDGSSTFEVRVGASLDDVEEAPDGNVSTGSSDLELVFSGGNQTVGIRLPNVSVPQGATIQNAYIQFQTDETPSGPADLLVEAEASDNASAFSGAVFEVSSRTTTAAAVSWSPPEWTTVGEAGPDQRTPNLAAVVQEVVDRPGWASGNAMIFIITGTGERTAEAYDGVSSAAPLLHIEYSTDAPSNTAPVASDDSYSVDEDVVLSVAAPGVLENDTDGDGDPLSASLNTHPSNGSVVLNADGSFTYTPSADFNGSDSFTYVVSDGVASDTGLVSITVNPVNDAPVAVDDAYSTSEDTVLSVAAPGVLGNDTDVDGDSLSSTVNTGPSNGSLSLNGDGSFTYTPNQGFSGSDSFTYDVSDGALTDTATVAITATTANDAPVASDDSYSVDEDVVLSVAAPGVLENDTDGDGDPLSASLNTDPSDGSVVLNADGSFTYTPNPDFNGVDSFTYTASDGIQDSNVATVSITVDPVNDAPVASDDTFATGQDNQLSVAAPGVLGNDTDGDGDPLTVASADTSSANGGGVTVAADGSFTYDPPAGFTGQDSFSYTATDGNLLSNTATVTVTVGDTTLDQVAIAETTSLGVVVSGDFTSTTTADGVGEVIEEESTNGNPRNRKSQLRHEWTFDVELGSAVVLTAVASRTSNTEGDDFLFEYSTDGGLTFVEAFVVDTPGLTSYETALPSDTNGQVVVRVRDTDRTAGHSSLDRVTVDALIITTSNPQPSLPMVSVTASDASAGETGDPGQILFTRDVTDSTVTVTYLIAGTADNGIDYVSITDTVTFPEGVASVSVDIVPIDDSIAEGEEIVSITLSEGTDYVVDVDNSAFVSIADDDDTGDVFRANSETTTHGSITAGDYTHTYLLDDDVEAITEELYAGNGKTRLEHTWAFDGVSGTQATFTIDAQPSGSEAFVFSYSLNGSTWVQITSGESFSLNGATTVFLRVQDTDSNRGDVVTDTIFVDRLLITTS